MLSYTQRRRRWLTLLVELDSTMMISEAFRTELLLEMSGISRHAARAMTLKAQHESW